MQWQDPQQPQGARSTQQKHTATPLSELDAKNIADEVFEQLKRHPRQAAERRRRRGKHLNEVIRIVDLATTNPVISDHHFENCVIQGPAVIAPIQQTTISNCSLGGQADEILWTLPPSASGIVVGAIGLVNCSFERCRFQGVGFAGPPDFLDQMRASPTDPTP